MTDLFRANSPSSAPAPFSDQPAERYLYQAEFTREELWDSATIDKVLDDFPKGHIPCADLFLILAECMANAVLHGQAETLVLTARKRAGLLLLSFYQAPKMQGRVATVLSLARAGKIRECASDLPGGLGFPILLRLVYRITISTDFSRLQLWIRPKKD